MAGTGPWPPASHAKLRHGLLEREPAVHLPAGMPPPLAPGGGVLQLNTQWPESGPDKCLLQVPASYRPGEPAPLIVSFHGAGAPAEQGLEILEPFANEHGALVLSYKSSGSTWDAIRSRRFGADVHALDRHLCEVVRRGYEVDNTRVAAGGFSDGASYALSVALANPGRPFTHVLAFSPGFYIEPDGEQGGGGGPDPSRPSHRPPQVYISHGSADRVLPVNCSRRIVPRLRGANHTVVYDEFAGGHEVPRRCAKVAVGWFADRPPGRHAER